MEAKIMVTGCILAGGAGRRLGGVDKGWQPLGGQPLIQQMLRLLRPQVGALMISANRNFERYGALGVPLVKDCEAGFQGPLQGILAGLEAARTDWVLFVPCDVPGLPADTLSKLWQAGPAAGLDIAMAEDEQQLHPVIALVRRTLAEDLRAFLASGERAVRRWYQRHRWGTAHFPAAALVNLNTPEAFQQAEVSRLVPPTAISEPVLCADHLPIPVLGIVAPSGTGKTTLIEALLPRLIQRGLRVAVIKHTHHRFDIDTPGKDSYRLRQAGAKPIIVASSERQALMVETPQQEALDLLALLARARQDGPDLIIVEGFKAWPLPKLELYRAELGQPLRALEDPWIQAVASPDPLPLPVGVEGLALNQIESLTDWVTRWPARWPELRRGPR